MPRRLAPEHGTLALSLDRALLALQKQLAGLDKFKQRRFDEAEADETEWAHLTRSIIEGAFGKPSSNLSEFYSAQSAGVHNIGGVGPQQRQYNFELRVNEYNTLLRSVIGELKLYLPEAMEIKGVYEAAEEYDFYRDLSSLILRAARGVFIVDAYLDERVFDLYIAKVPSAVGVRILSNRIGANVETVARMFAKKEPLQLRSNADLHDRAVFVDQRGWVVGQSIKDAAQKKPTYMIELTEPTLSASRDVHDRMWLAAKVVI